MTRLILPLVGEGTSLQPYTHAMASKFFSFWVAVFLVSAMFSATAAPATDWPSVRLASPDQVELSGPVGAELRRGLDRLAEPPYTADWLLADLSFKLDRAFTNYSGDVSGRFLELASRTSLPGQYSPATLLPFLEEITKYQTADGHYGGEMDFSQPMHFGSAPFPCSGATRGCWWGWWRGQWVPPA